MSYLWFPFEFSAELPCRGHCYHGKFLHMSFPSLVLATPKLSPPPTPMLTLPEFFQCLSNLPTATSPVSLSGILGHPTPLSTCIQQVWPRTQSHTFRSSPRSSPSYGLRWQLALYSKAMATAWDLITQTHLVLWGFVMNGILTGL
jgi:hypothetical protein